MGMTIAQKILKAHLVDGEMVLGQEIGLKIDQTLTQDATDEEIAARKNLALTQKIRYMSKKTTRDKLMEFLLDQAKQQGSMEFVIPYDRQALADYLGVERSAMSAEIGKLKKAGLIDSSGSRFRVL